jgi:hypothetical protein
MLLGGNIRILANWWFFRPWIFVVFDFSISCTLKCFLKRLNSTIWFEALTRAFIVHWNYVSSRGSSLLRFDWLFQLPSKEFSRHQFTVLYIVTEVTISNVLRAACFRLVLECVRLARKLHRFFVMQNIMVYTTGWNWAANGNNNWSLRNAVLAADLFLATKTGCVF